MHREYQSWFSPSLGRDMELLVFGRGGARVLVFPTSKGRFYEWEDRGMIAALAEYLERGWLQIYCVDSVDAESWYAKHRPPAERVQRHEQYERYIDEVLPLADNRNPNPFTIATGTSFGAYHAVNLAFRHPRVVGRVIGLSGLYDIREVTGGQADADVYFHNPVEFISNEHEQSRLEALRPVEVILAIGRDDPAWANNEHLSRLLWAKGLPHALRVWDGWCHDWPYWQQMIRCYIGGHD